VRLLTLMPGRLAVRGKPMTIAPLCLAIALPIAVGPSVASASTTVKRSSCSARAARSFPVSSAAGHAGGL